FRSRRRISCCSGPRTCGPSARLLAPELLRVPHMRPDALLRDREELLGVVAVVMYPLVQQIPHGEPPDLGVLDTVSKLLGLDRPDELDAVVPPPHKLHPDALRHARAVLPIYRDLRLIPRARLRLAGPDLADPSGESALLRLDEVPHDLIRAPLIRI